MAYPSDALAVRLSTLLAAIAVTSSLNLCCHNTTDGPVISTSWLMGSMTNIEENSVGGCPLGPEDAAW